MTSPPQVTAYDGLWSAVSKPFDAGCPRLTSRWPFVVTVVVVLCLLVNVAPHLPTINVSLRWFASDDVVPVYGPPRSRLANGSTSLDVRIKEIPDARPAMCSNVTYDSKLLHRSTTLIVKFTDYEFYDVEVTLSSLSLNADQIDLDAIAEVILVDDATTLDHVRRDIDAYVSDHSKRTQPFPVRLIRTVEIQRRVRRWPLAIGSDAARSSIVVFVKAGVVFGRGWLAPLIHPLLVHKKRRPSVFESHLDVLHSPISLSYWKTADDLVPVPSWSLAVRMRRPMRDRKLNASDVVSQQRLYRPVPALRGSAFAVSLADLEALGGLFDEKLDFGGGGEYLDFSLRLWTCGAGIKATCSRVGVPDLDDEVRVVSPINARRLTEKWFSEHKTLVARFGGKLEHDLAAAGDNDEDEHNKQSRNDSVALVNPASRKRANCKDFGWYLKTTSQLLAPVHNDSTHFGSLRVQTNLCAYVGADQRIDLAGCEPDRIPHHDMVFEMTSAGKLSVAGSKWCLTQSTSNYVLADLCKSSRDGNQIWTYNHNGELINDASKQCATHVTDPDEKHRGRQIMMAQPCQPNNVENSQKFKKWNFVLP